MVHERTAQFTSSACLSYQLVFMTFFGQPQHHAGVFWRLAESEIDSVLFLAMSNDAAHCELRNIAFLLLFRLSWWPIELTFTEY